ncbi:MULTISPECIES: LLM class F420-dependent oxidoreductase [Streptomyces]|uniref:Probable F420-dependent oxidoreductase, Rv3520c family n=1 Tax=Streptomyces misionensis TaxID=67331 RepID=A0A1H5G185_9ACTN|nr:MULTISPECIES: LLM class F420-dependent oxidoreductase [Streptomyces]SEE09291.1 probable F420-dependent oxidoreductase, Rv3520c family [Streptomyces misionensis]SFY53652.1 Putative coenzyme F420-dependent oxidoreductase [Streptomyces sp. F-1]
MKISMQLKYDGDIVGAAAQVAELERAGLDLVWVPEAYGYDAPSFMGFLAARTERLEIGSGILSVYSRTPALLAMTAAGVDALSGGRCHLGLGSSGPQVVEGLHGVPFTAPVTRTRETIEVMRAFWKRDKPVSYEGASVRLPLPEGQGSGLGIPMRLLTPPVRPSVPVWVAALGPKNVRMVAETADGWLPMFFVPEWCDQVWGPALRAGAAARDPRLGPLRVSAGGLLAIGPDAARARELARGQLALFIGGMGAPGHNYYHDLVARYGYAKEAQAIQRLFRAGDRTGAAAAVPDALLEATTICGPEGYVRDRLAAYREAGVTHLQIVPVPQDGESEASVVARLKEITG